MRSERQAIAIPPQASAGAAELVSASVEDYPAEPIPMRGVGELLLNDVEAMRIMQQVEARGFTEARSARKSGSRDSRDGPDRVTRCLAEYVEGAVPDRPGSQRGEVKRPQHGPCSALAAVARLRAEPERDIKCEPVALEGAIYGRRLANRSAILSKFT